MKICYLADIGSIHTQRWVKYFADNGHEVHLISLKSRDDNIGNLKFYQIKPRKRIISFPINTISYMLQVKKLIEKIKPDILHAHYISGYGVIGALTGFHPFVATCWGSDILISPTKSKISKFFVKYALKHTDLVTLDSYYLREIAISYGAPIDNSYIIQWGVDTNTFKPINSSIKAELGVDNNCPIVISTRSFEPIYNIDIIIKSIPFVLKEEPDTKFILKNGYGTKGPELIDLARKLGVLNSIIFIDKMLDHSKMSYLLNASDIFVSVPSSDGTSVSLLEAMACRLPVIVSDLPANREWVNNGWNGYVVPIRSEKALTDAIIELIKDENRRKLFGKRNRVLVKEKADYERNMKKMERLYESLLRR